MTLHHHKINCFVAGFVAGVLSLGVLLVGAYYWQQRDQVAVPLYCVTVVPDVSGNASHEFTGPCRIIGKDE